MGAPATEIHHEVEFKFRVPTDFDLTKILSGGFSATPEATRSMSAIYFDSPTATLLRWGITMRHRTGGPDAGWHLKLPTAGKKVAKGATQRTEVHASGSKDHPPAEFMAIVAALLRDSEVSPLARVDTERQPFTISRESRELIEIVDDLVQVFQGDKQVDSFREIEVELIDPHGLELAQSLAQQLLAAGAVESSISKAAAAFGPMVNKQPDVPIIPTPKKSALPYELVRWAITQQVHKVIRAELTSHLQESTGQLLTELQHLVLLLQALSPYLDKSESDELIAEITWLVSEFSSTDQLLAEQELASKAARKIRDPRDQEAAQQAIGSYFEHKVQGAQSSARAAQRSDRYLYLFSDLMDFAKVPSVTESAFEPQKFWNRIDPQMLHITAEIFAPIFPKKAAKISHGKKTNSNIPLKLNAPSDILRTIALDPGTSGAGAFALGVAVGGLHG